MPLKKGETKKEFEKKRMHDFKEGNMHSGTKHGPVVSNPKQAVAIMLSEERAGKKKTKKRK
jgi:hypothetical protein